MFSSRLPLSSLIELCRVLRHYLGAGLMLRDVFRKQAEKGDANVRPVAQRISQALERGEDLEKALKQESNVFPPLWVAMTVVGEQTGMLPEVFTELEKYYLRQQQLRRQFLSQITWPVVQFVLAVLTLALLIIILDWLPRNEGFGQARYDPLGFGLFGVSGALIFLGIIAGILGGGFAIYQLVTRSLKQRAAVHDMLLRWPAIGPALRALALGRFCLALRLTTETGMAIAKALRLSLRATGNEAYAAQIPKIEASVRSGEDLTSTLSLPNLFPEEFRNVLAVGEESGQLTEVLRRQAEFYHEEAGHRLTALTRVASSGVWLLVAILIIVVIFRLFGSYLSQLNGV
jgi:type II secretory pathway component PulF